MVGVSIIVLGIMLGVTSSVSALDDANGTISTVIEVPIQAEKENIPVAKAPVQEVNVLTTDEPVDPLKELKDKAQSGDIEAQLNLGYTYLYGTNGINIDYKQALHYYEMAAAQNSAVAYNNMGSLYFSGIGTDVDYKKALGFFEKAAELGSHDASVNLAIIYLNDSGKPKTKETFDKIISLLEQAQTDNTVAKFLLGYAYYQGFNVKQNYKKAFKLIKEAADAQYDEAQYVLSELYAKGYGVTKNYTHAIEYLQQASNQGNSTASMALADILVEGKIYTKDIKKAHVLYNISSVMGVEGASEKRDALESNLPIEDLLTIQAEAENYKPVSSEQTKIIRQTFGDSLRIYIDNCLSDFKKLNQKQQENK